MDAQSQNLEPVYLSLEFTPNPNTLKYAINRVLSPVAAINMTSPQEAALKSPLGAKLFAIPGIAAVMIGKDFVTVSKSDEGDWDLVHKNASAIIQAFLEAGEQVLADGALPSGNSAQGEVALKIQAFLNNEIRPAVAQDGGDIAFDRYEDGVVYLFLQGSCSGCPSARATLKQGIEARLKQMIPEIKEVVSVN